ncbi:F-box protein CPR1-like [Spinacia oleracea]|uniref:F-box protein CPR1-like n=1 Tax=Spinacia oleracea TaxID=3562 RepID=A0A9R0JMY5_SPIOL|nr:F-box protein CPR1-like [Spinacia oleracea]
MEKLPADIFFSILIRVPIKFIVRSKSVNKSWLSLISSSEFTTILKQNNPLSTPLLHNTSSDRLIAFTNKRCLYSVKLDDTKLASKAEKFPFPPSLEKLGDTRIVASCNDLLLCTCGVNNQYPSALVLLNPLTKVYHQINLESCIGIKWYSTFGIGYDDLNDEYKVISMNDWVPYKVYVYSLRDGYWKTKLFLGNSNQQSDLKFREGSGVLIPSLTTNGAAVVGCHLLHYIQEIPFKRRIICFDVCKEKWSEVPLPQLEDERDRINDIGILDGCLCFVKVDRVNQRVGVLWVMKEYGVKESWIPVISVPDIFPMMPIIAVSSGMKQMLMKLSFSENIFWYNLKHKTDTRAPVYDSQGRKLDELNKVRLVTCCRRISPATFRLL